MNSEYIIDFLSKNGTFIKNNLMTKINKNLNVMMAIFIILSTENIEEKYKNYYLLEEYILKNNHLKNEDETDIFLVLSTIKMFVQRVYGISKEINCLNEVLDEYENKENNSLKNSKQKVLYIS